MNYSIRISVIVVLSVGSLWAQLQASHQPTMTASLARPKSHAAAPGSPVARVNGVEISQADFDQEMRRVFPYFSMHGNAIPQEYEQSVRQKALNNLIDSELAYQEAVRRKLAITPAELQKRMAEIRNDYSSAAEFNADVVRLFGSRTVFEAKLRHDMLLDKIFLIEVKRKAAVADSEVLKEYTEHRAMYVVPEHIAFQSISVMFPKNPTAADKQRARRRIEQILPQARQAAATYERFGLLAERVSEDEYRVMMGEHKMVHRGSLDLQFESAFSMKEGEISGIIESPVGYHILRLMKHEPQKQLSFAEVRASIKQGMEKERLSARNKAFHEDLRKHAKVEIL